jgi:hypothetical protein
VIIKGNFQWTSRLTTSTDRIKGIIWQILQHPDEFTGEIIVCDNTQEIGTGINQNDNNSEDPEQSIVDVVNTFASKGYPVSLRDWNYVGNVVVEEYSAGDYNDGYTYEPNSKISYPKFTSASGNYNISLRYGIWDPNSSSYDLDRLCIIDFAVLKAHGMAGATIAIKNWIGVLTTAYVNERYGGYDSMHYNYLFGQYALVAKVMGVTFPKLTIVDAAWTSASSNWQLTDTIRTDMLLGSTDPCAVSWYAAKYILTPIAVDPYNTDPDRIGSNYKNNLSAWTNCLKDSGFAVTIDSSEISVYNLSIIPVELTSFSANINSGFVVLNWRTSTETNNYGFQVERGTDQVIFDKIAFVLGSGTTTEIKNYNYIDTTATLGKCYYRLKQLDYDGSFSYSQIVEIDFGLPTKFAVYQNYPNPFNPITTINYQIAIKSQVSLKVYDMLGNEVLSLINEEQESGYYKVKLNSNNLSSGVYIYRLQAGSFVETRKMILLK